MWQALGLSGHGEGLLMGPGSSHFSERDFDAICDKVLRGRRDPDEIVLPTKLQRCCGGKKSIQKPTWFTPEHIFNFIHAFAVFVLAYGVAWSWVAVQSKEVPRDIWWLPLSLCKLGYPMVPVIILCWLQRQGQDSQGKWFRMTPGYYFANLKMSLLLSLGPGFLLGCIGKLMVLKLCGVERLLGMTYSEFMLPIAWLLGVVLWFCISGPYFRKFGSKLEQEERQREDWGLYERWVVEPDSEKNWHEWIRAGPDYAFSIIPAPRYGTFMNIGRADYLRATGITLCCSIAWLSLIILGLVCPEILKQFDAIAQRNTAAAMLIHTDAPNLITNTLTAPFLVWWTWRPEPGSTGFFQAVMRKFAIYDSPSSGDTKASNLLSKSASADYEVEYRNAQPWLVFDALGREKEELRKELEEAIAKRAEKAAALASPAVSNENNGA